MLSMQTHSFEEKGMCSHIEHSFEEKGYTNFVKTYVDCENTFFQRIG